MRPRKRGLTSQNRNDVSVLKGRAAKRTSPRVYTGTASEAARCAPFPRQARKLRICSRLLPDPPESLRWIPSEMRGRERARSDAAASRQSPAQRVCREQRGMTVSVDEAAQARPHLTNPKHRFGFGRKNGEADAQFSASAGNGAERARSDVIPSTCCRSRFF